ncbi:unnamed protein product [Linum tenue]|uniref:AAA+ ATPase domain-containing protein n=1 Tax=Linum tenue TaxID=586396 RepID=A0AAV0NG59_9ROSI|nr:unnamed protein product [Linum tenue]
MENFLFPATRTYKYQARIGGRGQKPVSVTNSYSTSKIRKWRTREKKLSRPGASKWTTTSSAFTPSNSAPIRHWRRAIPPPHTCSVSASSASSTRTLSPTSTKLLLAPSAAKPSPSSTPLAELSFLNPTGRAFERADTAPGKVFGKKIDIDVEKIKKSKYFRALVQQQNIKHPSDLGNQLDKQQNPSCKPAKVSGQAKLTSLYGNNVTKAYGRLQRGSSVPKSNSNVDCMIVKSTQYTNPRSNGGLSNYGKADEREKGYGNTTGSKRSFMEINSPRNDIPKSPSCDEDSNVDGSGKGFVTARAKLEMDARQKQGLTGSPSASFSPQRNVINRGYGARSYGHSNRGIRGNFVPPIKSNGGYNPGNVIGLQGKNDDSTRRCMELLCGPDGELPEKLRNLEPSLIEHVSNEIMERDPNVRWDDIAGLDHAKKCVTEMVIWPLLRPDIFKGCRSPGRGLLLFGPPGTGKTMIGKAIAGEAKATFFSISASSLTSKWLGEGEKLVRALFGVASCRQPAVIFVDEIDSLLSQKEVIRCQYTFSLRGKTLNMVAAQV